MNTKNASFAINVFMFIVSLIGFYLISLDFKNGTTTNWTYFSILIFSANLIFNSIKILKYIKNN